MASRNIVEHEGVEHEGIEPMVHPYSKDNLMAENQKTAEAGPNINTKLLLIAAAITGLSGLCVLMMRDAQDPSVERDDHAADSQWANEGGANSPPSV